MYCSSDNGMDHQKERVTLFKPSVIERTTPSKILNPQKFKNIVCNLLLNLHPICVNNWMHPLCIKSIYKFYLNCRTIFLEYNGDRYTLNIHIHEALLSAANYGNIIIVKWCLKNDADIHSYDEGALKCAVYNNDLELVQLLLDKGANVHAINDAILQQASKYQFLEVVQLLQTYK